jgi:DNA repair exonuclease SbcCD ATPase subunit
VDDWLTELEEHVEAVHQRHQLHHKKLEEAHEEHARAMEKLHAVMESHDSSVATVKAHLQQSSKLPNGNAGSAAVLQANGGLAHAALLESHQRLKEAHDVVSDHHDKAQELIAAYQDHIDSKDEDEGSLELAHELHEQIHNALTALSQLFTPHGSVTALHEAVEHVHAALLKEDSFVTGFEGVDDVHVLDAALLTMRN